MVNFDSLRDVAERLVRENGRDVTFIRTEETPANASQPWRGPGQASSGAAAIEESLTVPAAVIPFEAEDVDGQLIRRTDKRAIVSAKALDEAAVSAGISTPVRLETYDRAIDRGREHKIKAVEVFDPSETGLAFSVQLRE